MRSSRLAARQLQKFFDLAVREHVAKPISQCNQPCFILAVKAIEHRAVDIQNAHQRAVYFQRNHDLGIAGGIAGDMAGKSVHVVDALHFILRYCRTTHPLPTGMRTQAILP